MTIVQRQADGDADDDHECCGHDDDGDAERLRCAIAGHAYYHRRLP